jgi:hypothetical protein
MSMIGVVEQHRPVAIRLRPSRWEGILIAGAGGRSVIATLSIA